MTTQAATPLTTTSRFEAQPRLLRALNAMRRAEEATRETQQLVARTRPSWATPARVVAISDASATERE